MSTDPTKYHAPIEPTQAAYPSPPISYSNPYDTPNPYAIAPPPPPKPQRTTLLVVWMLLSCLVVIGGGFLIFFLRANQAQAPSASTVQFHDATTIVQDFQGHDLPLDHLAYGVTINQFVGTDYNTIITTQSSAQFVDPSLCNGGCEVGSVWLGVYRSSIDAQSEYNGLLSYRTASSQNGGPGPGALYSIVQDGHCVLIGEDATSEYAAILRDDCK